MAIKSYVDSNGEKFYEVYVGVRSATGGKHQMRKRGTKTLQAARTEEFLQDTRQTISCDYPFASLKSDSCISSTGWTLERNFSGWNKGYERGDSKSPLSNSVKS